MAKTYAVLKNGSAAPGTVVVDSLGRGVYTEPNMLAGASYQFVVTENGVSRIFSAGTVNVAPNEPAFPLIVELPAAFDSWSLPVNITRLDVRDYTVDAEADDLMPATDETLYVSTTGSDSDDGSSGTPKLTIAGALAAASGTPRILIAPGSYALPTTISRDCILEGNGGEWAPNAEYTITATGRRIGWRGLRVDYKITTSGTPIHVFDSPICNVSSGTSNIRIQSNSTAYIYDLVASDLNAADVLSFAGAAKVLTVRCEIEDVGSSSNDNCSTGHDFCRLVEVMPIYRNAYRNMHHVASGGQTKFIVFGGSSKQSKGSQSLGNSFNIGAGFSETGSDAVTGWLYGVDADDTGMANEALHSLFAATGSTIYYDNETLFKNTGGAGTFTLFERVVSEPSPAEGGVITEDDGDYVHTFLENGSFVLSSSATVDLLLVAGGGGGGSASTSTGQGGAGGAGEVVYSTSVSLAAGTYPIVVGGGGTKGTGGAAGSAGSNTTGFSLTALGGGFGGGQSSLNGGSGGSGGSGAAAATAGTAGTSTADDGVGFAAGTGNGSVSVANERHTGGGGGAGEAGQNATSSARGLGGAGVSNSITGTATTYGVGGDGCSNIAPRTTTTTPVGYGSGGHAGRTVDGFDGNQGIVIVRVRT